MSTTTILSLVLSLAGCLALLIYNVFLMLAIGKDCEALKNPKTTMWMLLTFFFGSIVGLIYLARRKKNVIVSAPVKMCAYCSKQNDMNSLTCSACGSDKLVLTETDTFTPDEKLKKKSKRLFAVAVVFLIVGVALSVASSYLAGSNLSNDLDYDIFAIEHYAYDVDGQTTYYDKNGNSYIDVYEVVYYDENGTGYLYMLDDEGYPCFSNNTTEEQTSSYNCFVDTSGYFVIDENSEITGDIDEEGYDIRYFDKNGNEYFSATFVSWDSDGNLVDSETGELLLSDN